MLRTSDANDSDCLYDTALAAAAVTAAVSARAVMPVFGRTAMPGSMQSAAAAEMSRFICSLMGWVTFSFRLVEVVGEHRLSRFSLLLLLFYILSVFIRFLLLFVPDLLPERIAIIARCNHFVNL